MCLRTTVHGRVASTCTTRSVGRMAWQGAGDFNDCAKILVGMLETTTMQEREQSGRYRDWELVVVLLNEAPVL